MSHPSDDCTALIVSVLRPQVVLVFDAMGGGRRETVRTTNAGEIDVVFCATQEADNWIIAEVLLQRHSQYNLIPMLFSYCCILKPRTYNTNRCCVLPICRQTGCCSQELSKCCWPLMTLALRTASLALSLYLPSASSGRYLRCVILCSQ